MANTVFVGLSGGVDSAVSAAILKERGLNVVGTFIKIWQPTFLECTWREDRLDAMRVCAALEIPYTELDLSDVYKKDVIDRMLADYAAGITPNPDVLCNRSVKFGAFLQWARQQGADAVATGHYARVEKDLTTQRLLRGVDPSKDQSYFLYLLDRADLARLIFPVGGMQKAHVRQKAIDLGLPVAQKADSQGLCFVGEVSMRDFLRRYIEVHDGDVLNASGAVIGRHEGATLYTLGQRHGFELFGDADEKPHFVTKIDPMRNVITVSERREDALVQKITLHEPHWIGKAVSLPKTFDVQARYREKTVRATISHEGSQYCASFETPHLASPGQALVFYEGDVCIGGAVIAPTPIARVHSEHLARTQTVQ